MQNNNKKISLIVMTGLMTAFTFIATMFLKIPTGIGYIHLGDGLILLSAMVLPLGYAIFAGAVGAALADIIGGFAVWAPWTLVIKACVVLVFRACISGLHKKESLKEPVKNGLPLPEFFGYLLSAVVTCGGYYIGGSVLYGSWITPLAEIPLNALQLGVGAVLAFFISRALCKSSLREQMYYQR